MSAFFRPKRVRSTLAKPRPLSLRPALRAAFALGAFVAFSPLPDIASAEAVGANAAPTQINAERAIDLDGLLHAFAEMPGFEARFEEEKFLALLAVPLRSEGRLFFAKPRRLLRRVESPRPQDILISKNAIRIREGGREEVIDLAARGEIRPLVESLLWVFSGDRKALERAFETEFEFSEATQGWRLRLTPKNESLAALIDRLELSGSGLGADTIEVLEAGGDRSLMRVFDANPARRFSAAEEASLFGISESASDAKND